MSTPSPKEGQSEFAVEKAAERERDAEASDFAHEKLVERVRNEQRVTRLSRYTKAAAIGCATSAVVILVLCLVYIINIASTLQQVQNQNKGVIAQIADCSTPTGQCYKQSKQATEDAVNEIVAKIDTLGTTRHGDTLNEIAAMKAALAKLCAAQNISCPSLNN